MREKITAALIVKDEEKVLERCLRSLRGLDEIVVLDTGSTDKTGKIAKDMGAKTSYHLPPLPFHFANERNEAAKLSSNDWIVSIDADEVLQAGSTARLRQLIEKYPDAGAVKVTFLDEGRVEKKIRIFRKSAWEWRYRVHELLFPKEGQGKILEGEKVIFEHYGEKGKRQGQNLELLELCVKENPEYHRAFRHLGQELISLKRHAEAIPHLAQYLEKTTEDSLEKSQVMMYMGTCYAETGRLEDGLKWYDLAAAEDTRRREPLYLAAWYLMKDAKTTRELLAACDYLERLLAIPISKKPGSKFDVRSIWGGEPARILAYCREQIELSNKAAGLS